MGVKGRILLQLLQSKHATSALEATAWSPPPAPPRDTAAHVLYIDEPMPTPPYPPTPTPYGLQRSKAMRIEFADAAQRSLSPRRPRCLITSSGKYTHRNAPIVHGSAYGAAVPSVSSIAGARHAAADAALALPRPRGRGAAAGGSSERAGGGRGGCDGLGGGACVDGEECGMFSCESTPCGRQCRWRGPPWRSRTWRPLPGLREPVGGAGGGAGTRGVALPGLGWGRPPCRGAAVCTENVGDGVGSRAPAPW